jgi:hypothetical protein
MSRTYPENNNIMVLFKNFYKKSHETVINLQTLINVKTKENKDNKKY